MLTIFFFVFLETFETHFDPVTSEVGAEIFFCSKCVDIFLHTFQTILKIKKSKNKNIGGKKFGWESSTTLNPAVRGGSAPHIPSRGCVPGPACF